MAEANDGAEQHPRLSLFARSQLPVAASLTIVRLLMLVFGIPIEQPVLLACGAISVGLITVSALVLPWERWPTRVQVIPATLDLVALTAVAIALYSQLDTIAVLTAFPGIWLAVIAGWWGVAIGVVGVYAASILPVLLRFQSEQPRDWAAALVIPGVLLVVIVVARLLTARFERDARTLRLESQQREAASAESTRLGTVLRSFADGVDLGMLFMDEHGQSVVFNKALLEFGDLARYTDETGHGIRMYAADQVTPIPPDEQPLQRVRRGEALDGLLHWVGPRGAQRALLANGRQVHTADGALAGSIIIVQDVTDVVRSGRAREDALTTLAHELRTPLTSIVGYTDLLALDPLTPESAARVEVVARNAEHLLALTTNFLDGLHREVAVTRGRFVVRELVDATVDVLVATPGFTERDLVVDINPSLRATGDRDGLTEVLTNLLSNAVKFSRPGDRVEIEAAEEDPWMRITVRNSGSGIDPHDLERIFDRFYRGANAQRDAIAGTGIGLSVSREIVAAHGGTLTADAVASGASFTICLPRD